MEFFETVKAICAREQIDVEQILARDTVNYFNVSYRKPTKWFLRYFTNGKRRAIVTPLPVEEVRALVGEFECEEAPSAFGTSRIYIDYPAQMWALGELVIRSFQRAAGEDLAANA